MGTALGPGPLCGGLVRCGRGRDSVGPSRAEARCPVPSGNSSRTRRTCSWWWTCCWAGTCATTCSRTPGVPRRTREAVRLRDGAGLDYLRGQHIIHRVWGGGAAAPRAPGRPCPRPALAARLLSQAWHLAQAPAPSQLLSCTDEAPRGAAMSEQVRPARGAGAFTTRGCLHLL